MSHEGPRGPDDADNGGPGRTPRDRVRVRVAAEDDALHRATSIP
jgi:hypothetical protein